MRSAAPTIAAYLAELPTDRRAALQTVRDTIRANLHPDYEEGMQYGMIGYYVPHRVYPPGYHCDPTQPLPLAGLASQKNHMAVYLMGVYADPETAAWFQTAWTATGRKLDMGKACVRFRRLEDVALDVLGAAIARVPPTMLISLYEAQTAARRRPRQR
jgi:hypothetical protein